MTKLETPAIPAAAEQFEVVILTPLGAPLRGTRKATIRLLSVTFGQPSGTRNFPVGDHR